MDVETRRAIEILEEDIGLHRKYLRMDQKNLFDPGYDMTSLRALADDIMIKQDMIETLKADDPSPVKLKMDIQQIREQYIPTHEGYIGNKTAPREWQGDKHHKQWIKNYQFISDVMERRLNGK